MTYLRIDKKKGQTNIVRGVTQIRLAAGSDCPGSIWAVNLFNRICPDCWSIRISGSAFKRWEIVCRSALWTNNDCVDGRAPTVGLEFTEACALGLWLSVVILWLLQWIWLILLTCRISFTKPSSQKLVELCLQIECKKISSNINSFWMVYDAMASNFLCIV